MSTNAFVLALCFCAFSFAAPTSATETLKTGVVVRLSVAGLNYTAHEGGKILASQVKGARNFIPDINETTGTTTLSIRNISVTKFIITQMNVNISTGDGIFWRVERAQLFLTGLWDYTDGTLNVPYNAVSGKVHISAEGLHITIHATIGIKSDERPAVILLNCSSSIDKVMISYKNGILKNDARASMTTSFRKQMLDAMCQAAGDVVTRNAAAELETFNLCENVTDRFTVDYRLVETPGLYDDFVQTAHSGEFRLTGKPFGPSFLPSKLDLPKSVQSMVTFYVSEYVINSLAEAMFTLHQFSAVITKTDLPPTNNNTLTTSCANNRTCVGSAFPEISRRYPNASVVLALRATTRPVLTIGNDSAYLTSELEMSFVIAPGHSQGVIAIMLSLKGSATVNVAFVGDKVVGEILNINLTVVNITGNATSIDFQESVTPDSDNLNRLLKIIGNLVILPALNKAAAIGFRLPTLEGIQFVNSKLTIFPGAFAVGADFVYKAEAFRSEK